MLFQLALLLALLPTPTLRARLGLASLAPPIRLARRTLASAAASDDVGGLTLSAPAEAADGAAAGAVAAAGAEAGDATEVAEDSVRTGSAVHVAGVAAATILSFLSLLRLRKLGVKGARGALFAGAAALYQLRKSPRMMGLALLCAAPMLPSAIHRVMHTVHLVTQVAKQTLTPEYRRATYTDSFLEATQRPLSFAAWALAAIYALRVLGPAQLLSAEALAMVETLRTVCLQSAGFWALFNLVKKWEQVAISIYLSV